MTVNAAQLLKRLEPAVRPGAALGAPVKPQSAFESQSFEQLLATAAKGGIHSGRQIELAFEPTPALLPSQLERLAAAADQAEAGGAKRALMLIDGRGFVLDVASRTLVAELSSHSDMRMLNTDAAIFVAQGEDSQFTNMKLPGDGNIPPAVLKQILTAQTNQTTHNDQSQPAHAEHRRAAG